MNLWVVTDDVDWQEFGLFAHVWAWGADEARDVAWDNYEYREMGERPSLSARIHHPWPNRDTWPTPLMAIPHAEARWSVLRELGWHYEDEDYCDACERYPFGSDDPEHTVCPDCNFCGSCAMEETEYCLCVAEVEEAANAAKS